MHDWTNEEATLLWNRLIKVEDKLKELELLDIDIDKLTARVQTLEQARQDQRAFNQEVIEHMKAKPSSGNGFFNRFIKR